MKSTMKQLAKEKHKYTSNRSLLHRDLELVFATKSALMVDLGNYNLPN